MKNKILVIFIAIFFAIGLLGCGNDVAKKALEQGKKALNEKKYDIALASFQLVIDNDKKNEEANLLKGIVNDYLESKKYFEEKKYEESKNKIKDINPKYKEYEIKNDVVILKEKIDKAIKDKTEIDKKIKELNELYSTKKYKEAKDIIMELDEEELEEKQKEEVNNIKNKITTDLEKIENDKKLEESRRKVEEENRRKIEQEKKLETKQSKKDSKEEINRAINAIYKRLNLSRSNDEVYFMEKGGYVDSAENKNEIREKYYVFGIIIDQGESDSNILVDKDTFEMYTFAPDRIIRKIKQ